MKHLCLKEIHQKVQGAVNILRNGYLEDRKNGWNAQFDAKIMKQLAHKGDEFKIQAAVLNPPKYGELDLVSSFSFVEIIDVLCEGPIAGISISKLGNNTSNGGIAVTDSNILKGIFLDSTPIAVD